MTFDEATGAQWTLLVVLGTAAGAFGGCALVARLTGQRGLFRWCVRVLKVVAVLWLGIVLWLAAGSVGGGSDGGGGGAVGGVTAVS
jgi:hypothetical protein